MKNVESAWRRFILLTLLGGLFYNCNSCGAHRVQNVLEGQLCRDKNICMKVRDCQILNFQPCFEAVERCGFSFPYGEELICCPKQPSEDSKFNYLTSLQYYNTYWNKEYHCTGIVISPNHVLSTSKCEKMGGNRVNAADIPSDSTEPDEYAIKEQTTKYNNDLVRFELNKKISQNLNEVKWCNASDSGVENFLAIGFAQSKIENDKNYCGLFQQKLKLISPANCVGANNDLNVEIDMENSHLCMEAVLENDQDSNCVQCLTASASVLHVRRADGTLCVTGIATPTTNECLRRKKELVYYTLIKREMFL